MAAIVFLLGFLMANLATTGLLSLTVPLFMCMCLCVIYTFTYETMCQCVSFSIKTSIAKAMHAVKEYSFNSGNIVNYLLCKKCWKQDHLQYAKKFHDSQDFKRLDKFTSLLKMTRTSIMQSDSFVLIPHISMFLAKIEFSGKPEISSSHKSA